MAVIINVIIIFMELIGLYLSYRHVGKWMIIFYTEISNFLALIASLLFVMGKDAVLLRYVSCCMLGMTFLVSLFVLSPAGGYRETMFEGECLYHHTLIPILSLVSYVFWEGHSSSWLIPVAVTLFYGIVMIWLNLIDKIEGPYDFLMIKRNGLKATVLWILVLLIVISGISVGIALLSGA